jgi:hypothetical protein
MRLTSMLTAIGLGAAGMYLFDPERGNRRRAQLRDQMNGAMNSKKQSVNVMYRDFVNRSQGVYCDMKTMFEPGDAPDETIVERVRSQMGRWATHPSSIEVTCEEGNITLRGLILNDEVQSLIQNARRIKGVRTVNNELEVHDQSENIPGLQGVGHMPQSDRWSPATCLVMGTVGLVMTLSGAAKRGGVGGLMTIAGLGLVTKSFNDTENRFAPTRQRVQEGRGSEPEGTLPDMEANTQMI